MMETTLRLISQARSEICFRWENSGYPFKHTVFQGIDHGAIVQGQDILEAIASIVGVAASQL
jgi:hypothetical protein